jgi:hypothetical protein
MNISKDEVIKEILNLEDMLSQVTNFQVKLTKDARKSFYNNYTMDRLGHRHNMLIQTLGSVLAPSSSAI